jgi:zinc/manganese transport system substrate-binding protein
MATERPQQPALLQWLRRIHVWALAAVGILPALSAAQEARLRVVTTTPTYGSLVEMLGGTRVEVRSIMRGPENIHRVLATPIKMAQLSTADLFIHSGLDLEIWVPPLLRGARNPRLLPGQPGNLNCAQGIQLKEVPGEISRAQGELHIYGNPHYALDPVNLIIIARNIRDRLKQLDPAYAGQYEANYHQFEAQMKKHLIKWLTRMRPYRGTKVVGYHNVFPYFADRFGLQVIGYVEPKPGIEPSPRHVAELIAVMKKEGCRILLLNTWADRRTAEAIAGETGAVIVPFPEWVGGVPEATDVFSHMDYLIERLSAAIERTQQAVPSPGQRS